MAQTPKVEKNKKPLVFD